MRKFLSLVAVFCCMMFGTTTSLKAADLADGVKISLGSTVIDSDNKGGVTHTDLTTGTIKYDDVKHVLTLDDIYYNSSEAGITIDASALDADVTIRIKGTNNYISTDDDCCIWLKGAKAGRGLILEAEGGKADIDFYSWKYGVIVCRKSYSDDSEAAYFPLTINGGLDIDANSAFGASGTSYYAISCHHYVFNQATLLAYGKNKQHIDAKVPAQNVLNKTYMVKNDKYGMSFAPYNEAYPVWVNGRQLNDQQKNLNNVYYNASTRTITVGNNISESSAEAAILINDEVETTKPIIMDLSTGTGVQIAGSASSHALVIKSPVVLKSNTPMFPITINASEDALVLEAPLTIQGGGHVKVSSSAAGSYAIHGTGAAKLTIDATKMTVNGKGQCIEVTAHELKGVQITKPSGAEWKDADTYPSLSGPPVQDQDLVFEANEYVLEATADPADAGTVTFKDGTTTLTNPYRHDGSGKDITMTAVPNKGYSFAYWNDGLSTDAERSVSISKSWDSYVAHFCYDVKTTLPFYAISWRDVKALTNNLVGTTTDVGTISGSNEINCSSYAGGDIYYFEDNSSQFSFNSVAFTPTEATKLGTPVEIIAPQTEWTSPTCMAYNPADGAMYAVIQSSSLAQYCLVKINGNTIEQQMDGVEFNPYAFAFDNAGKLYAVYNISSELCFVSVDMAAKTVTKIGTFTAETMQPAMAYDAGLDKFIYMTENSGVDFYVIDKTNADCKWAGHCSTLNSPRGLFAYTAPKPKQKITIKSDDEAKGTVSPSGTFNYEQGMKVTISATPKKGYLFDKWSDNGAQSHQIEVGNEDATYTASFKKDPNVYPIYIAGEQLTASKSTLTTTDLPGVLTAGTISYDATAKELILDQVKLSYTGDWNIRCGESDAQNEGFTIVVKDKCEIIASAGAIAFFNLGAVKFVGDGTSPELIVKGTAGIYIEGTDLTIEGLKTTVTGTTSGISGKGNEVLTIKGAAVSVTGTGLGSITGIKNLKTEFCEMDAAHEFVAANKQVEKSGIVAKDEVKFVPYPMLEVTPVEKGTGHFELKCGDKKFTDKGWFKAGDEISIVAVPEKGFEFGHWTDDPSWTDPDAKVAANKHATITMPSADKEYNGLAIFYYKSSSSAKWYGINDGKFVAFSMKDYGAKVIKTDHPDPASVKAGDFVNGQWYFLDGSDVKSMKFSGLTKDDQELDKNNTPKDVVTGVTVSATDIAYDILSRKAYAVDGSSKLYVVNEKEKQLDEVGDFEYEENPKKVVAIAFDGKKVPYLLSSDDGGVLYTGKIDTKNKKIILSLVGKKEDGGKVGIAVANTAQSIAFDHAKNEILWGEAKYLRVINPAKGAKAYIAGDLGQADGSQGVVKSLHNMAKAVSVSVEVADGQSDWGEVDVAQGTLITGMSTTITATAKPGYHFVYWVEEESPEDKIEESTYEVTNVTSSVTYIAYFAEGEGIESITIDPTIKVQKVLIDGVIYIVRDGRIYTITGQMMK